MRTQKALWLLVIVIFMNGFLMNELKAQQTVVDSSVLDRITELEKQTSYNKPGMDHFMVVGLATVGFASIKNTTTIGGVSSVSKTNSFPDADHFEFSPMLLWRHGQKFLLEFEPSFSGNSLGVNWADVSYFAAPNLIIRAGYLVLPFGTYSKRLAAGWIDKLPTDPMGIADMAPTDYGVEVEGGLPLGSMKMSYDLALSNGSQLMPDGTLGAGNITDNNNNKTLTGRVALLPFSNSSLEIGVSGMFGKVGDVSTSPTAKGNAYAFDLNYVKLFNPILLNIKSQYNIQDINSNVAQVDSLPYTSNTHATSFFAQGSIRPTGASGFIKNLELAGRYTTYNNPAGSNGLIQNAVTVGLNYWINWRTVFKVGYESYTGNINAASTSNKINSLFLQFSIQL
ncbi:MAG: hypothetical protein JST58_15005 [Bacteroidetes bacterium]|nr:hypothetical protein [Bacteroidota bacterium]